MKSCIYAYQYSAAIVLKSFREKEKKNKMQVRPLSERTQAPRGVSGPNRGTRLETPEKAEKPEQERSAQERPSGSDRPERSERSYRNRTADRAAEGNTERTQGREKACSEREKAARVSGTERAADRRSGNRAVPENEKREDRPAYGRRERFERRSLRRGERPEVEKNEVVRDPAQGELPFRAYMETGSLRRSGIRQQRCLYSRYSGRKKVICRWSANRPRRRRSRNHRCKVCDRNRTIKLNHRIYRMASKQ